MSYAEPPPDEPSDRPGRPRRMSRRRPGSRSPGRPSPLAATVIVLGVLVGVLLLVAHLWTEIAWFTQLDLRTVWTTRIGWQLGLFAVAALLMGVAVAVNLVIAYRTRPVYAPTFDDATSSLERYRASVDPLRRLFGIGLPVVLGLFAGSAAAQEWKSWLLFTNGGDFGTDDPEFGYDLGFYVFKLPFLEFLVGFLLALFAASLVVAAITHYIYGGIKLAGNGPRTTPAARRQLGILAALLLFSQAGSYWLGRYGVLSENSPGDFTGASYTGVNAVLPAQAILAMLAVVVALTFLVPVFTGSWRLPAIALVLMLVASIAVGGAYPALVQQLQVKPSEQIREAAYIERNIDGTRAAFGLDTVDVIPFTPSVTGQAQALKNDAVTTASIRLLDPAIVSPAFVQLQRQRGYYTFPEALDVDRYQIDGQTRDTVIALRELNLEQLAQQQNWVNRHIVYTHGFGAVAAYGNQRSPDGEPAFFERDIPSVGALGEYEQRVYFGEEMTQFSIVGAEEGATPREIDYPTGGEESNVAKNTFSGDGGPTVGSLWSRLMFALKFRDQNIVLSGDINSQSQILYDRTPLERVEKVAPFLTVDGDPYPAVVNGRIVWILDGYTTSDRYPYSQRQVLSDVSRDTLTATTQIQVPRGEINYIRNSVKATVDAYDGSVTLYQWDEDPVLDAWKQAMPGVIKPMSEIDGQLMSHLRYPEDMFKVQRELLGRYHMTDPGEFFSNQDAWQVPQDPTRSEAQAKQPPYYLTLQMPEQETPSFSLTSAYIPKSTSSTGTSSLSGFLAVNADAGSETGVRSDDYGQLRLLRLPESSPVPGPGQVQADFNSNPTSQNDLNLLRTGGSSRVILGNLLTLPIGGGLLYVQPVYVQAESGTSFPLLRKVLVSFGSEIGYADTLDEALNQVFGGDSGAAAGDADTVPEDGSTPVDQTSEQRLNAALQEAQAALEEGQAALAEGDFAAYGVAQEKLANALQAAVDAEAAVSAVDGTATATPSPTETADG